MRNRTGLQLFALAVSLMAAMPLQAQVAVPHDTLHLRMESVQAEPILEWAASRSARTVTHFSAMPVYDSLLAEVRAVRAGSQLLPLGNVRPPPPVVTGPFADGIVGGIWFRQPLDAYQTGAGVPTRILDLDSLSRAEEGKYEIASLECLEPEYERCLVRLSRDGRRTAELREFDVRRREFVTDGFRLADARLTPHGRDANSIYITTKPRGQAGSARIWRRGQSLDEAQTIFTSESKHRAPSFERQGRHLLLLHSHDQYDIEYYVVQDDDELVPLPVPRDVREIVFVDARMVVRLRSAWMPADVAFPSGSVIGVELEQFLAGSREFELIMPSNRELVVDKTWNTDRLLIVRALADMKLRLFEFTYRDGAWERRRVAIPENGAVEVRNLLPDSDTYYFTHEDFLSPRTVYVRQPSGEVVLGARVAPAFAADSFAVAQWHATSADGTRVPYFVVHHKSMPLDGSNPVIVNGYGGNGLSMLPDYLSLYGPTWLSRGGVYVLANIRGGNEYGPEWHYAARRENRQRAFDDFQAVAQDLIDREVTSPKLVGTYGASNGGLLVGISFVQRPDLYGAVWANNGVLELQRCSSASGDPPVGERGDGEDPNDWAYMRRYSPFHNVVAGQPYPPLLLTTNRADDVVHPCHARKFAARLEEFGYRDVFFYETEEGGHGKAYSEDEQAMIITFFLRSLHPDYE